MTPEERRQASEWSAEHPWSLTLRQFLTRVESVYGLRLKYITAESPYLQSEDKTITVHLPGLELDDQLTPESTRSLCRRISGTGTIRIPQEDFGLEPEEPP